MISKTTRAREIYGEAVIYERHRHRYEVNNLLRKRLVEAAGWSCPARRPTSASSRSSSSPDHPFFVASQYHPEFKSRPDRPAPLFREICPRRARLGRGGSGRPAPTSRPRPPRRKRAGCPRAGSSGRREAGSARRRRLRLNETFAGAVPDLEPVRRGARGRRRGRPPCCARWAWRSTRTTPPAQPARSAATCSPGCRDRPARRRSCSAPTWTPVPLAAGVDPVVVEGGCKDANHGDPRRRQQGGGGGDARDRAPRHG